jgi:hypothetical protein
MANILPSYSILKYLNYAVCEVKYSMLDFTRKKLNVLIFGVKLL